VAEHWASWLMAIGRHGTGAVHADEELHIVGKLVV